MVFVSSVQVEDATHIKLGMDPRAVELTTGRLILSDEAVFFIAGPTNTGKRQMTTGLGGTMDYAIHTPDPVSSSIADLNRELETLLDEIRELPPAEQLKKAPGSMRVLVNDIEAASFSGPLGPVTLKTRSLGDEYSFKIPNGSRRDVDRWLAQHSIRMAAVDDSQKKTAPTLARAVKWAVVLAALVLGVVVTVAAIQDIQKKFRRRSIGSRFAAAIVNAPGAKALRAAGYVEAKVTDMHEALVVLKTVNPTAPASKWTHPNPFVTCRLREPEPALDCAFAASTYASAANPTEDFILAVMVDDKPAESCYGVYSFEGEWQRDGTDSLQAAELLYEKPRKAANRQ